MIDLINKPFLETLDDNDKNNYIFKVEIIGDYVTTQDVKPFKEEKYRKIADLNQFIEWLKMQPYIFKAKGYCEEITEIWKIVKPCVEYKKEYSQPIMKLIWTKDRGWIGQEKYRKGELELL